MISATTPEKLWKVANTLKEKGVDGLLISGGSNKDGVVELYPFLDTMKRIKTELNMFVSCHVGLVDKELADGLKKASVNAVLLDIIGDDQTIREVYKLLHRSVRDYEESLKPLKEVGHNIVPHI